MVAQWLLVQNPLSTLTRSNVFNGERSEALLVANGAYGFEGELSLSLSTFNHDMLLQVYGPCLP